MNKKIILFALALIISVSCTGCWDRLEIEELGIIVGMAFDIAHHEDDKQSGDNDQENAVSSDEMDDMEEGNVKGNFKMTLQYVYPKSMGGESSGNSIPQEPYINIQSEGTTVLHLINDVYNVSSRVPRYDHLKTIVISEELARSYNLYKFLNAVMKHPEIPYTCVVVISDGPASSIFELEPDLEALPAFEVNSLARVVKYTSNRPRYITFGTLARYMANNRSFAIQRVSCENGILKITGAAVIKAGEFKFAGWLNERETEGLNWLMSDAEGGILEVISEKTGEIVSCWVAKDDCKITPVIKDNKIDFKVEVEAEAIIAEDWAMSFNAIKQNYIKEIETYMVKEAEDIIKTTLNKIQKECKADVANFGRTVKNKYPELWKNIKDNWDEEFSKAEIDVKVKLNLRASARKVSK